MKKALSLILIFLVLSIGLLQSSLGYLPARDFAVCEDGSPRCFIVVGANAAPEDAATAQLLFEKLGDSCYQYLQVDDGYLKAHVTIYLENVLFQDEALSIEQLATHNLILVGGPVANALVMDLVEQDLTTVAFWEASDGDVISFGSVFSETCQVVVVAGSDRDATRDAACAFISSVDWDIEQPAPPQTETPRATWSPPKKIYISLGGTETLDGHEVCVTDIKIFEDKVSGTVDGTPFTGILPFQIATDDETIRIEVVNSLMSAQGNYLVEIRYSYLG